MFLAGLVALRPMVEAEAAPEAGHVVASARVEEARIYERFRFEKGKVHLRNGVLAPRWCIETSQLCFGLTHRIDTLAAVR